MSKKYTHYLLASLLLIGSAVNANEPEETTQVVKEEAPAQPPAQPTGCGCSGK